MSMHKERETDRSVQPFRTPENMVHSVERNSLPLPSGGRGLGQGGGACAMLFGRMPMSMLTGVHAGEHGTLQILTLTPVPSPSRGEWSHFVSNCGSRSNTWS